VQMTFGSLGMWIVTYSDTFEYSSITFHLVLHI
jgi:hypothetical protein